MKKLIVAGTIACALALAPAAAATVLPGVTYSGTGSEGGTITVEVSPEGDTADFEAANFSASCAGSTVGFNNIELTDYNFFVTANDPYRWVYGAFTSPGVVTGTVHLNFSCNTGAVAWTATADTSWADLTVRRSNERPGKARGNGTYNENAAKQSRDWKVKPGKSRTFKVDLQNDGTVAGDFVLRGCKGSGPLAVSYKVGPKDVTKKVTSKNGFKVKRLDDGDEVPLQVKFDASKQAKKGKKKTCKITAETNALVPSGTQLDAVKATVKVN